MLGIFEEAGGFLALLANVDELSVKQVDHISL